MAQEKQLRRTSLDACHEAAGGRMVPFAGWRMPVHYSSLLAEHESVRTAAGLFDVSHMGEFRVHGPDAEAYLQSLTPNDVSKLKPGRAHYSALLTEKAVYVDDLLVYRLTANEFMIVVNAANVEKDFQWMDSHRRGDIALENVSDDYALLALQGPRALEILAPLSSENVSAIRYYRFKTGTVAGASALISRTGYTGEDGFELYLAPEDAPEVWNRLLEAGEPLGLQPAGLGARDTLRLEAGMALYGHEIDETITPWEADLGWTVKLSKGDFLGRDALVENPSERRRRQLVGFEIRGRGIARQGHAVLENGEEIGRVTSGTFSPTFKKALGMAYVPTRLAAAGTALTIDVRGKSLDAMVVETPFYRRTKS